MTEMLTIKNWESFQHYKKRNPPWIKLHRALLDDYEFCSLPDVSKAHLMLIWIYASQNGGKVPLDAAFLERRLSINGLNLELLVERGFLTLGRASKVLHDASKVLPTEKTLRREENSAAHSFNDNGPKPGIDAKAKEGA